MLSMSLNLMIKREKSLHTMTAGLQTNGTQGGEGGLYGEGHPGCHWKSPSLGAKTTQGPLAQSEYRLKSDPGPPSRSRLSTYSESSIPREKSEIWRQCDRRHPRRSRVDGSRWFAPAISTSCSCRDDPTSSSPKLCHPRTKSIVYKPLMKMCETPSWPCSIAVDWRLSHLKGAIHGPEMTQKLAPQPRQPHSMHPQAHHVTTARCPPSDARLASGGPRRPRRLLASEKDQ
jgi:hypothetical protein